MIFHEKYFLCPILLGILYLIYAYPEFRQFKITIVIESKNAGHKGMYLPLFYHELPKAVDHKSVFARVSMYMYVSAYLGKFCRDSTSVTKY